MTGEPLSFSPRAWRRAIAVAALSAGLHLAWGSATFQYDDLHSIVANPHIRDLSNAPRFFTGSVMFSGNAWAGMYRPLVLVAHAVSWAAGGGDPGPFRVFNAVLHGLNSGAVVLVMMALGMGPGRAALSGVVFGLLPVNSEVAHYFSSRSESLCALFLMLAFTLYAYGRSVESNRWRWQVASAGCYGLSLLSKEVGMVLPALLVAYELPACPGWGAAARWGRALWRRQWMYWLLGATYLVGMQGHLATATVTEPVRGYGAQFATQTKAWVYYLGLLWHPTGLSVEHQFRLVTGWAQAAPVVAALGLLLSVIWVAARLRRSQRAVFLLSWAALSLLPTSVVPLNVLVNEHRLYLAAVPFAALVAWAIGDLLRRRGPSCLIVPLALVLTYGALSATRSALWADPGLLWSDAAARAPLMPRPHLFMGDHHFAAGRNAQALAEYAVAESVYPIVLSPGDRLQLHNNRGAVLLAMGRFSEARGEYERALRIDPEYALSREALEGLRAIGGETRDRAAQGLHQSGMAAMIAGNLSEAADLLRRSLAVQSWPETWLSLGMVLERLGLNAEASAAYESLVVAGRGTPFEATGRARLEALGGIR